jgi:hypothetical protein
MSQTTDIKLHGLSETLRYMKSYEKEAYKTIQRDLKTIATPIAVKVGQGFPSKAMTRWKGTGRYNGTARNKSGFPKYSQAAAVKSVKPAQSAGKKKAGVHPILRLEQKDAGGAVFDSAGSKSSNRFVKNLDTYGEIKGSSQVGAYRSRVLFPATQGELPAVQLQLKVVLDQVNRYFAKAINS